MRRLRGGRSGLPLLAVFALMSLVASAASPDSRLIDAARRGDAKAIQELIRGRADVNAPQPDGATALHWAAHRGDGTIADLLIGAGANVNAVEEGGVTPLALAATNADEAMAERLIKAGANPNAGRETAVMAAARSGSAPVMRLLLAAGGDPNAKEPLRGQTALMWAAAEKHPETLRLLLQKGADVKARTQAPPEAPGAKPRAGNAPGANGANGYTALLFATRAGDLESVGVLLDAGADVQDSGTDGLTALLLATVRGHAKLAMALLDRGADAKAAGPGFTALHWAAGSWETELTVTSISPEREGEEWTTVSGLRGEQRSRPGQGAAAARCRSERAHHQNPAAGRVIEEPAVAGARRRHALPRGGRRRIGRGHARAGGPWRRCASAHQARGDAVDGRRGHGARDRRGVRA